MHTNPTPIGGMIANSLVRSVCHRVASCCKPAYLSARLTKAVCFFECVRPYRMGFAAIWTLARNHSTSFCGVITRIALSSPANFYGSVRSFVFVGAKFIVGFFGPAGLACLHLCSIARFRDGPHWQLPRGDYPA
jgi:hypothetical protein